MPGEDGNLARLRRLLAQALRLAEVAPNARERETWLEMAEHWRERISSIEAPPQPKDPGKKGGSSAT